MNDEQQKVWGHSQVIFAIPKRLILKKSEPACLCREDNQQEDEVEQPRRIRDKEKGVFRRDAGRAAVRGQNWHGRTSAVFAVSSN